MGLRLGWGVTPTESNGWSEQWLGYGLGDPRVESRSKQEFDIFPNSSRQTRISPSPLFNGCQGFFHHRYSGRGVKLTNLLHPVPRLGMSMYIPPLPLTPSWSVLGQHIFCVYRKQEEWIQNFSTKRSFTYIQADGLQKNPFEMTF